MQCVAHASGQGQISAANASTLAANGLVYESEPPAFLASTAQTPFGRASYARSPSAEGQVWAVGYDGGTCLIFTLGTAIGPIEKRLGEMFAIPGTWKAETPSEATEGERKLQYGWTIRPDLKLNALVSLRELPPPAAGMTMVTVGRTTGKTGN